MPYLGHTAHLQLVALWAGVIGWIMLGVAMGLIQWRVWYVEDVATVTSGVAWVGVWRACFYSRVLVTSELELLFCQAVPFLSAFTPPEISAAQALMVAALLAGAGGHSSATFGLRNLYFGWDERRDIRVAFSLAGALYLLAGGSSLLPLAWNMSSVLSNRTIAFPPRFHLPAAPVRQEVGGAIMLGVVGALIVIVTGLVFLAYRFPPNMQDLRLHQSSLQSRDPGNTGYTGDVANGPSQSHRGESSRREKPTGSYSAWSNPAFDMQESSVDILPNSHQRLI